MRTGCWARSPTRRRRRGPGPRPTTTCPTRAGADARGRRLPAVPADELPLGEDAIELVSEDPGPDVAADRAEETAALGAEAPVEAYLDTDAQPALDESLELDAS